MLALEIIILLLGAFIILVIVHRVDQHEKKIRSMDEYIMSKIMASNSGKYDGIFTPHPKELQVYRTRRDRIKSQS